MSELKPDGHDLDVSVAMELGINVHIALGEKLSTTWDGMRLVVEEMQRRGYNMVLLMKNAEYGCGFSKNVNKSAVDSISAPHAVCLAALKALDGDSHDA